jgi:hypothetical protein
MKSRVAQLLAYAASLPLLGYAAGSVIYAEAGTCCNYGADCPESTQVCCTTPEGTQPCHSTYRHYCKDGTNWCS